MASLRKEHSRLFEKGYFFPSFIRRSNKHKVTIFIEQNDVLRGGFGVYGYEEPILLIWRHSEKSRTDLGWDETVGHSLEMAKKQDGQTLFERIVGIIQEHAHVELRLE